MQYNPSRYEVDRKTGFFTIGYGYGSSPTFTNLTVTGTALFADGTAAAPSIAFASQTGTGFFRNTSNVEVAINGTSSLRFSASGAISGVTGGAILGLYTAGQISLIAGGTNQNITITPSGAGSVLLGASGGNISAASGVGSYTFSDAFGYGMSVSGAGLVLGTVGVGQILFKTGAGVEAARILSNQNFLLGTTTDNSATFAVNRSGTGPANSGSTSTAAIRAVDVSNDLALDIGVNSTSSPYPGWIQVHGRTNQATNYPLSLNPNGGVVLVNTSANSGNGALQLAESTASTGGIGFGPDTSLYRAGAGQLGLSHASLPVFSLYEGSTNTGELYSSSGNVVLGSKAASTSLTFRTVNTTALTLTSAQQVQVNATIASTSTSSGALVVSGGVGVAGAIYAGGYASTASHARIGASGSIVALSAASNVDSGLPAAWNGNFGLGVYYSGSSSNTILIGDGSAGTTIFATRTASANTSRITIDNTNGNTTFAGSIAIGNTVQTAVAVASTHKVTISIGGSTYYLLATNV